MPDIEKIYKQYGKNQEEVIILAVANPSSDEYPNNADVSKDEIIAFLDENGYTFPVVFDETGNLLSEYLISAFPTTFLIDKEGNISGYAPGMLTKDMMDNVIEQTLNSTQ
jgi:cytochrome c-type biogenesis protein